MAATNATTSTGVYSTGPKLQAASERNVLYNYRSYTYNFALGYISAGAVEDQSKVANELKKNAIINTAGKGSAGLNYTPASSADQSTQSLVQGFNKSSSGSYDLFMDNVRFTGFLTPSVQGGAAVASLVEFDVYEPYGVSGFLEALQVSAKAAGHTDFMKGPMCLSVSFVGYSDTASEPQARAEAVPMSTRYFKVLITEMDVDVNEIGTKYRVKAAPLPMHGLATPNVLTSDIKTYGNTVGESLFNLFKSINQMVKDRAETEKTTSGRDLYEISVPKLSKVGEKQNTNSALLTSPTGNSFTNDIIKAKINNISSSANVAMTPDPAQIADGYQGETVDKAADGSKTTSFSATPPSSGKNVAKVSTQMFSAQTNIHDAVAAIVRDSEYTRDILRNIDKVKNGDGMVDYFIVRMENKLGEFDKVNNKYFQTYRYVLEPYRIHYTQLPNQQLGETKLDGIKDTIVREYNYIYTGKNEDILKFGLKFDNLYYSGLPALLGNRIAGNELANAAGPDNQVEIKRAPSEAVSDQSNQLPPLPSSGVDPYAGTSADAAGVKSGQQLNDPYARLAEGLHDAVLNQANLLEGTLEILGDPYYLVTGGAVNGDLELAAPLMTKTGEAPITQNMIYININFRNPVDINPKTGFMDFSPNPIAYSGVYGIKQVESRFNGGVFTQVLTIFRLPGQVVGNKTPKLAATEQTSPLPNQQIVKDVAPATVLKSGVRPSDFSLDKLLGRGLPSVGLPGNISNFTNKLLGGAAGALNQTVPTGSSLLNKVSGALGGITSKLNQLGTDPLTGINQLTSGVRLSSSNFGNLTKNLNPSAVNLTAAGNSIGNLTSIPNAPVGLADSVAGTFNFSSFGQSPSALKQDVSSISNNFGSGITSQVGNVQDKVSSLQNSFSSDPSGIASKMGLDPSVISGLGTPLNSQLTGELSALASKIPANSGISGLLKQGMSFARLTGDKLSNLPALQSPAVAPAVLTDPALAGLVGEYGDLSKGVSNIPGLPALTNISKVSNPLGGLVAGQVGGFGNAASSMGSLGSIQGLVNNTVGNLGGLTGGNVGSLGQNMISGRSPAGLGLGSVESNINNVTSLSQNITNRTIGLDKSVVNQFGSQQTSPLAKLINNSNLKGLF